MLKLKQFPHTCGTLPHHAFLTLNARADCALLHAEAKDLWMTSSGAAGDVGEPLMISSYMFWTCAEPHVVTAERVLM